jgi:uncharacterized protein (TIGR02266 family)
MVTKGVDEADFERCWLAGCDDIVVKPINRNYFLAIANKYLGISYRNSPRFIARLRIHYGPDSEKLLSGYIVNVSTGGVFIETEKSLPVNTLLTIEFILPENNVIHCKGKVAWINREENRHQNLPSGMGIQFLDITLEEMERMRVYIKEETLFPFW